MGIPSGNVALLVQPRIYLITSSSGVSFGNDMSMGLASSASDLLRPVVLALDRAGVDAACDGHLQRKELGRRGVERRAGGGERDADGWPGLAASAGPPRRGTRAGREHCRHLARRRYCGHQVAELTR